MGIPYMPINGPKAPLRGLGVSGFWCWVCVSGFRDVQASGRGVDGLESRVQVL